jgi:Na+/pantothenate symporter
MQQSLRLRQRLVLATIAFAAAWIPASLILGINHGRALRLSGSESGTLGPLLEGVLNFAFLTAVPALFVGLVVFVVHAALTERS